MGILTANRSVDANTSGANNYISPWTGQFAQSYTGKKQYELSNHLGNVLATITDKKIGVSLASDSSLIDHYEADVKTAQDYYPFGMVMPGRMFTAISIPGGTYSGTTTVNGYTLPVDLTVSSRTGTTPSTYTATHNIDLTEGFESVTNDDVTAYIADTSYAGGGNGDDDGSAIAGSGKYRYGFNGKEKDDEVKGVGDQIDYGMRVYDPRVGRFMSLDPLQKKYPELSPYQVASNSPIAHIDLDGLEKALPWYLRENKYGGKPVLTLGLGDLPTAERWEYGDHPWYSDESVFTFARNTVASGWNGIANTWNDAMNGKTGTDIAAESIQNIQETKPSDFKKAQTWENIFGGILTAYAIKRIGGAYGSVVRSAESALARNRTTFAKGFYEEAGYSPTKTLDHIKGIDLTKPVSEVTYKKGTQLEQWTYVDEQGNPKMGDYYTIPGTDPTKLGIPLKGRVKTTVVLTEDTKFLKSTTADIPDWRPGETGTLQGGGTQLFQAGVKYKIKK